MRNLTASNILAAGVAIAAFVLAIVGKMDLIVAALFIALAIAVLLKPPQP